MDILNIAPERFANIYATLDPVEQETLKQILHELSESGESETYNNVWLQDYEEIPADIDTFLEDDHYLGMNSANNLEAQGREHLAQIISIGKVKGLSHINNIPESGWSNQVAAIPGYGYIYRVSWWNYTPISYARIFVVNYITSTSGGIIGATIKYQPYWEPETK